MASNTTASPTNKGRQLSYMLLFSSAFIAISGPMLAGSPMVIPIIGLSGISFYGVWVQFTFLRGGLQDALLLRLLIKTKAPRINDPGRFV
jgi:hypothetical protein